MRICTRKHFFLVVQITVVLLSKFFSSFFQKADDLLKKKIGGINLLFIQTIMCSFSVVFLFV